MAGRRLRYDLRLPPGAYSAAPTWASRQRWLEVVLVGAVRLGRDVLRRHHVAPETLVRVMALHAMHADDTTGRGCTIDVEHLRHEAGCSERTVQRARAAARELGIATEVQRGRHLTLPERIEAYDRGSKQRGLASVYALGCPAWLARKLPQRMQTVPAHPQVSKVAGERGTPPVGRSTRSVPSPRSSLSSAPSADELASLDGHDHKGDATPGPVWPPVRHGPTPAELAGRRRSPAKRRWLQQHGRDDTTRQGPARRHNKRRRPRYSPAATHLANAVRQHVPALRDTPLGRLIPAHTRFAETDQPWSAEQLVHTAYRVARTKGWTVQQGKIRMPAAWWAGLLDGIDPTANPSEPHDEPPQAPHRSHRPAWGCATHWEAAARTERETAAAREREREQRLAQEERDTRAGRNLCTHGAGGADPVTSRSPRCALCRHQ